MLHEKLMIASTFVYLNSKCQQIQIQAVSNDSGHEDWQSVAAVADLTANVMKELKAGKLPLFQRVGLHRHQRTHCLFLRWLRLKFLR